MTSLIARLARPPIARSGFQSPAFHAGLGYRASVLAALVVLVLAGLDAGTGPVAAQDSWNPFADATGIPGAPEARRRRTTSAERPVAQPGPLLPPMSGVPRDDQRVLRQDPYGRQPSASGMAPADGSTPRRETFAPREAVQATDLAPLPAAAPPAAAAQSKNEPFDRRPSSHQPSLQAPGGWTPQHNAPSRDQVARTPGSPHAGPAAVTGTGFDTSAMAKALGGLAIPSRSPALSGLILRLFSASDGVLAGGTAEHLAMRAEVLFRAGMVDAAARLMAAADPAMLQPPAMQAQLARVALAAGDRERACGAARAAVAARHALPQRFATDVLVIQGYCAAADGNPAGAGLAAGLVRETGGGPAEIIAALDAVAVGEMPNLEGINRLQVVHWRLAELGKRTPRLPPIDRAEPAARAAIALSERPGALDRLHAAEAVARINALLPADLAAVYRLQSIPDDGSPARADAALRRALMFRAAEAEQTPFKKTRHVRVALDDARRNGLFLQMAAALAPVVATIRPVQEIGWFTETGIEVMLAAGRLDSARRWVAFGDRDAGRVGPAGNPLEHWLALIDIADPVGRSRRGDGLGSVEDMALRGRVSPDALHRLATVLDALDYQVPFRLWEASSRAPQPTSGYLPPTGVLSELNQAARSRDQARAILLVIRALGPDATDGAQIIALGDSIRALKRVGLEADARRLGFEALFALWPRAASS